jgi:hypothetical protein
LLKFLKGRLERWEGLPWLDGYTELGDFRPRGDPEGSISQEKIGNWLWVKARLEISGTTMDQSTDRLRGDPYYAIVKHDWVGLANSAPKTAAKPGDLDEWAIVDVRYVLENNDSGYWGSHNGKWVESVSQEGEVTIRVASGRYEDVSPESVASTETVSLS